MLGYFSEICVMQDIQKEIMPFEYSWIFFSNIMIRHHLVGFTFEEVVTLHSSKNKVVCCHFSSDGKLLASAGHEEKVVDVVHCLN
jgi:hypothetical protein